MGLHGDRSRGLRQAIPLDERRSTDRTTPAGPSRTPWPGTARPARGHHVRAGQPEADAAQIPLLCTGLQEQAVHGRHADEDPRPPALDEVEHGLGVESPGAATGTPARAKPSPAVKPMMWAMGRAITALAAGSTLSAPSRDAPINARWLSCPFGRPVVPDV